MSDWIKIDNFVREIAEEPWSLYWKEWKTGTREFEDYILNPLPHLAREIEGVDSSWTVSSELLNHHIPHVSNAVCNVGMIMYEEKRIKLLFYKHAPE